MYDILRTVEFLGYHISKNEIVSKKLLSFYNKMTNKKMILVTGVTPRKRSQCECFLEICEIWLNYVWHIKNNRISGWYYNAIRDPKNCDPNPKSTKMRSQKY